MTLTPAVRSRVPIWLFNTCGTAIDDGNRADQDRDQDDQNEGKREPGAQRHVPAPPVFVATICATTLLQSGVTPHAMLAWTPAPAKPPAGGLVVSPQPHSGSNRTRRRMGDGLLGHSRRQDVPPPGNPHAPRPAHGRRPDAHRGHPRAGVFAAEFEARIRGTGVAPLRVVALYLSFATEPGTGPLIDWLADQRVRALAPTLLPDADLGWMDVPDGPPLGLDAITDAEVILVPALAVDLRGHRLGRGGGSYDRALTRVRPGQTVLAVVHDDETS